MKECIPLDDFLPQLGAIASAGDSHRALSVTTAGAPVLINCGDVSPRPPEWLWTGRIPLGKLTLIIVEPQAGWRSSWPRGRRARPWGHMAPALGF
ncbi:MAG TPA: hypothetical protein VGX78_18035, partial [Pirellulales bacterium]|nr:hypothetical protein [Pirellulales bacterium]